MPFFLLLDLAQVEIIDFIVLYVCLIFVLDEVAHYICGKGPCLALRFEALACTPACFPNSCLLFLSLSLLIFPLFFILSFFLLSQPQQSPSYDDSRRTRFRLHQRQFHWCELTLLVLPYRDFNKYKQVYYNIIIYYSPLRRSFRAKMRASKWIFSFTFIVAVYFCQSYNEGRLYIATQTPVSSTVDDFWRMVWEQRSTIVVMLSDLTDNEMVRPYRSPPPRFFVVFFFPSIFFSFFKRVIANCLIWKINNYLQINL